MVGAYLHSVPDAKLRAEFVEVESGKKKDRPKLASALAACRIHKATLVIAKLDRLSRNLLFLAQMMESAVEFVCCDMPSANRMTLGILSAVAEGEARMISDRTKAALAAAKRRGVVLGGDHGATLTRAQQRNGNTASAQVRSEAAAQRARDLQPVLAELRQNGCTTLAALAAGLNERQIPTARGSQWSPVSVFRVLQVAN
jgi:DNA invertase Pin-like site-specific DNA recombinase